MALRMKGLRHKTRRGSMRLVVVVDDDDIEMEISEREANLIYQ
jgi:hypothetical protein